MSQMTEPCYRSVRVIDHVKTGENMRDIRLAARVGLRAVARRVGRIPESLHFQTTQRP